MCDILPPEMWAKIFEYLPLQSLATCRRVCKRFESLCLRTNIQQVIYQRRAGWSMDAIFLHACSEGNNEILTGLAHMMSEPKNFPSRGHALLWAMGLIGAIKNGHIGTVRELLSFGAIFDEKSILECCHRHLQMTSFLLDNFCISKDVLDKAIVKSYRHGRTDIEALLKSRRT